jgi:Ca-activated chloride channel family protein
LYVGEPIVIKALLDNELKQGDLLKISGNSALGTWGAELLVEQSDASPGVAAIWARARIENLMDRKRQGAAHEEIRKAVIDTALSHHLVSKYTSLVAVDKTPVRPAYSKLSKEQVPNLLPYGQSMNAIFGFPATATNAGAYRMNGALLVATALLLLLILMNCSRVLSSKSRIYATGPGRVHTGEGLVRAGAHATCMAQGSGR